MILLNSSPSLDAVASLAPTPGIRLIGWSVTFSDSHSIDVSEKEQESRFVLNLTSKHKKNIPNILSLFYLHFSTLLNDAQELVKC